MLDAFEAQQRRRRRRAQLRAALAERGQHGAAYDRVLVALLGALEERAPAALVFLGRAAARRRARERIGAQLVAFAPQQSLGRGADEGRGAEPDAVDEAIRLRVAQRAEHARRVEAAGLEQRAGSREHDLLELARVDRLRSARHRTREVRLRRLGASAEAAAGGAPQARARRATHFAGRRGLAGVRAVDRLGAEVTRADAREQQLRQPEAQCREAAPLGITRGVVPEAEATDQERTRLERSADAVELERAPQRLRARRRGLESLRDG